MFRKLLLVIGFAIINSISVADTIYIPVGQQAPELQGIEIPERGVIRDKVKEKFGEPLSVTQPVGDPPINNWEYENFYVYFEHDRVLHTVLKHKN